MNWFLERHPEAIQKGEGKLDAIVVLFMLKGGDFVVAGTLIP